jgi:ArsR family metal-binding transcriptional regulator
MRWNTWLMLLTEMRVHEVAASASLLNALELEDEDPTNHKVEISVNKLEQEMGRFLHVVHRLFNRAEQEADKKPGMRLDEIVLSVEINGEGKVSLIGSSAKATVRSLILSG